MHVVGYMLAVLSASLAAQGRTHSGPNSDTQAVEEFYIEHEITGAQAKNAVRDLNPEEVKAGAGCKECTRDEIRYCLGQRLINDHCCCDRRYKEYFPYVPHTCYLGEHLCETLANDCAEYTRLRICCCDKFVLKKWKALSKGSRNHQPTHLITILLSLMSFVYSIT